MKVNVSSLGTAGTGVTYDTISGVLLYANGSLLCYGKAEEAFGTGIGNYTFTIPADITGGATFYVFAEDVNDTNKTDYASNMIEPVYTVPVYKIIEGANSSFTQNSDGTVIIRGDGEFSKFMHIKVDGQVVGVRNYIKSEGSTRIAFAKEYLNSLAVGSHSFDMVWTDGSASTTFMINAPLANATPLDTSNASSARVTQKDAVPKTGDQTFTMYKIGRAHV